jgi:hypothetical protein
MASGLSSPWIVLVQPLFLGGRKTTVAGELSGKTFRACWPMDSLFSDQIDEVLQLGLLEVILFRGRRNVIDHHKAQYIGWC